MAVTSAGRNTTRGYALLPLAPVPLLGAQIGFLLLFRVFRLDVLNDLPVIETTAIAAVPLELGEVK